MKHLDKGRIFLMDGVMLGSFSIALAVHILGLKPSQEPPKPSTNFEVVDTYKGCDVVSWTNSMLAEYKYFLDCSSK